MQDQRLPFVSQGGFITSGERAEAMAEDLQAERSRQTKREHLAAGLDLDLADPVDAQEFDEREAAGELDDEVEDRDDEDW